MALGLSQVGVCGSGTLGDGHSICLLVSFLVSCCVMLRLRRLCPPGNTMNALGNTLQYIALLQIESYGFPHGIPHKQVFSALPNMT